MRTSSRGTAPTRGACRARRSIRSARRSGRCSRRSGRPTVYQTYVDQLKAKTPVRVTLDPPREKVVGRRKRLEGPGGGADRAHRVLGFPVPVLPAGVSDRQPGAEHLRRQDQVRLPALPASEPSQRAAGRRGVAVRRRAGPVLAVLREAVRGPDQAVRRRPEAVGGGRSAWTRRASTPASTRTSTRTAWKPTSARATTPASPAHPPSSSTAAC